MWGIVMLLGLSVAADPLRIGIAVLLTSRPRPIINLLAFWFGAMVAGFTIALSAFVLLGNFLPNLIQGVISAASSVTGGHTKFVIGVIALLIAAVSTVRLLRRPRPTPESLAELSGWAAEPGPTAFSRLMFRARRTLQGGHPGIAFVAGLSQGPAPVEFLAAVSVIHASGVSIGWQLGASIVFTIAMLAIIELLLVCYLIRPAQTQTILTSLYNWLRTYRQHILIVGTGALGIILVGSG